MIHKQIEKLIPYIGDNFISYQLSKEGVYIPFITLTKYIGINETIDDLQAKLEEFLTPNNYEFEVNRIGRNMYECLAYPSFYNKEDHSYEFKKDDWSLEELIELLIQSFK